jgi:hypothetical protein
MSSSTTTFDSGPLTPEPFGGSPPAAASATRQRAEAVWNYIDRFLVYTGDYLNPILVKETRQALKSSQFTITFVLVLIAAWIATIGVVAVIGPRIYYAAEGGTMLGWYFGILALPLIVVVPLAAFRSLIAEREDNTYDLLSITTLNPRQIITGKLGSSVAQMAVYFSVITPCLAFTYLLRGVDLPTIAALLAYTFFWSLGLSMIGILLAALTPQRFVQVFILVIFVAALFLNLWFAIVMGAMAATAGRAAVWGVGSVFWVLTLALGSAYIAFFAMAYFASAGLITFTSENRSTPLRICMLLAQAVFIGWMAYFWFQDYEDEAVVFALCVAGIFWYGMGTLLTAERPELSQRVRRKLPQSFIARMFLSWLNPGPGSGYMFVVANATTVVVLLLTATAVMIFRPTSSGSTHTDEILYLLVIGWSYLVSYLGIGLLVIGGLRRIATVTMLASVLINLLLLLAGFGVPYAIKSMSITLREADYSFIQITDPFCSMMHVTDGGAFKDANKIALVVFCAAVCVLMLNMPRVIRELRIVREAAPSRVIADEAELHPAPESLPQNPWDEPAAT